jgi:hypothetical protein
MAKRQSRTTPKSQMEPAQWVIEGILLSKFKLPPYFWRKKNTQASRTCREATQMWTRLHNPIGRALKNWGEEALIVAFIKMGHLQKTELLKKTRYNKMGEIYEQINFLCREEVERLERINSPKDTRPPDPIIFDAGADLRGKTVKKRKSLWRFLGE